MAEIARARAATQAALDAAKSLPAALLRAAFESDEAKGWEKRKLREMCETPQYGYTAPSTRENTGTKICVSLTFKMGALIGSLYLIARLPKLKQKNTCSKGAMFFSRGQAQRREKFSNYRCANCCFCVLPNSRASAFCFATRLSL